MSALAYASRRQWSPPWNGPTAQRRPSSGLPGGAAAPAAPNAVQASNHEEAAAAGPSSASSVSSSLEPDALDVLATWERAWMGLDRPGGVLSAPGSPGPAPQPAPAPPTTLAHGRGPPCHAPLAGPMRVEPITIRLPGAPGAPTGAPPLTPPGLAATPASPSHHAPSSTATQPIPAPPPSTYSSRPVHAAPAPGAATASIQVAAGRADPQASCSTEHKGTFDFASVFFSPLPFRCVARRARACG